MLGPGNNPQADYVNRVHEPLREDLPWRVRAPWGGKQSGPLRGERGVVKPKHGEEAVVQKNVRVKEEIGLRKVAGEQTKTVSDTVRHTEVEVEDDRCGYARGRQGGRPETFGVQHEHEALIQTDRSDEREPQRPALVHIFSARNVSARPNYR